jgi:hypothetical protein
MRPAKAHCNNSVIIRQSLEGPAPVSVRGVIVWLLTPQQWLREARKQSDFVAAHFSAPSLLRQRRSAVLPLLLKRLPWDLFGRQK